MSGSDIAAELDQKRREVLETLEMSQDERRRKLQFYDQAWNYLYKKEETKTDKEAVDSSKGTEQQVRSHDRSTVHHVAEKRIRKKLWRAVNDARDLDQNALKEIRELMLTLVTWETGISEGNSDKDVQAKRKKREEKVKLQNQFLANLFRPELKAREVKCLLDIFKKIYGDNTMDRRLAASPSGDSLNDQLAIGITRDKQSKTHVGRR